MNYVDLMGCDVCVKPDCKVEDICSAMGLFSKAVDRAKSNIKPQLNSILSAAVDQIHKLATEQDELRSQLENCRTIIKSRYMKDDESE